jgi:TPR repeat protein
MIDRENLPSKPLHHGIAVLAEQRGSLVARGLFAVQSCTKLALMKNNDALYRQSRNVYNQLTNDGFRSWSGNEEQKSPLTEALNAFQQLAAKGYGKAYFPLSTLFSGEQSINGDAAQAERFRKLAYDWLHANQHLNDLEIWHDLGAIKSGGDAHYLWQLGEMYSNGFKDRGLLGTSEVYEIEQNDEEAEYWYRKSAETGDCYYQWQLGELYSEGLGVAQDNEQALYWYRKAAEQGYPWTESDFGVDKFFELGKRYRYGEYGTQTDDDKALEYFLEAAKLDHAEAQYELFALHGENGEDADSDVLALWKAVSDRRARIERIRVVLL